MREVFFLVLLIPGVLCAQVEPPRFEVMDSGFYFLNDTAGNSGGAEIGYFQSPNAIDSATSHYVFARAGIDVSYNTSVVRDSGNAEAWLRLEFPDGPSSLNEILVTVQVGDVLPVLAGGPDLEVGALGSGAAASLDQSIVALDVTLYETSGPFVGNGVVAFDTATGNGTIVCVSCFDPQVLEFDDKIFVQAYRLPPGNGVAIDLTDGSERTTTAQGDNFTDPDNSSVLAPLNQALQYSGPLVSPSGELIQRVLGSNASSEVVQLVQNVGPRLTDDASPPPATGIQQYAQDTFQPGPLTLKGILTGIGGRTEQRCNSDGGCLSYCSVNESGSGHCYTRPEGPLGAPTGIRATVLFDPQDGSLLPQDFFFPVAGGINARVAALISGSNGSQSFFGASISDEDIAASVAKWADINTGGSGQLLALDGNFYDCLRVQTMTMSEGLLAIECRDQTTWTAAGSQLGGAQLSALLIAEPPDPTPNSPPIAIIGEAQAVGGNWSVDSQSFDPDGTLVAYNWDIRDRDGNVLLQTSTTVPSLTFDAQGETLVYVTLQVTDDRGGQDATEEPVNTSLSGGPSAAPVAIFSEECAWQFCRYTDISTDDEEIVSRFWQVTEIPTGGGEPTLLFYIEDPDFSWEYLAGNDQQVQLFVRDGDGQTDKANVVHGDDLIFRDEDDDLDGVFNIDDNCSKVPNGPLIPDAGGNVQRDSNADGFGSVCDPDLNNDGGTNFADLALFKGFFGTTAVDADFNGDGFVNFADLALFKAGFGKAPGPGNPEKFSPNAFFHFAKEPPPEVSPCVNSSRCAWEDISTDRDGEIVSRVWTVTSLPNTPPFAASSTEKIAEFNFPNPGTYAINLAVVDNDGLTDGDFINFTVSKINQPPVASFTVSCTPSLELGELVCTVQSTATDPDGSIIATAFRIWREGVEQPPISFLFEPSVEFTATSTEFVVQHTVLDDDGAEDMTTQEIDLKGE